MHCTFDSQMRRIDRSMRRTGLNWLTKKYTRKESIGTKQFELENEKHETKVKNELNSLNIVQIKSLKCALEIQIKKSNSNNFTWLLYSFFFIEINVINSLLVTAEHLSEWITLYIMFFSGNFENLFQIKIVREKPGKKASWKITKLKGES